jgi:integrase
VRGTKVEVRPGIWRLRVVTGYDPVSGNPRQVSRTVEGTQRQADTALAAFVAEADLGPMVSPDKLSLGGYLEWLAHVTPGLQPGTVRSYRTRCKRWTDELGKTRLTKVTAQLLDVTYSRWGREGMSPANIRMQHTVLAVALHQAVRWDLVPRAATDNAAPPRVQRFRATAPDVETVLRLIAEAAKTNPVLSATIMLAALTGARRGELAGLRWSDVDYDGAVLNIRRAAKLDEGKVVIGPTKTHADRRVSIDDGLRRVLEAHRRDVDAVAAAGQVHLVPDAYVLSRDPDGTAPIDPDSITQAFCRLVQRVGVQCRFHDLRHFTATQLIGFGLDPVTIAARLGHTDASTTLRIYSHALQERDQQAAAIMGKLLAPAPPLR